LLAAQVRKIFITMMAVGGCKTVNMDRFGVSLFLNTCFFLSLCLFESGCVRSHGPAVTRDSVSAEAVSAPEPAMKGTQKNLSMAKRLKEEGTSPYLLGPEDILEISVYRHEDLRMECTVSAEGKISYYLVGDVYAGGLTTLQLRDKVQEALATYIKNPQVVVRIVEPRSHKIFVLGQVKTPGVYRMRSDFTLIEAISAAGGITEDAYLGGAYVVRAKEVLLVNFHELIKKGNTEENIPLMTGDVIYIPDNKEQKVFVLGEVNKQAAIPMQDGLTLLGAIAEAGGFTRDAKKNSIVVMRGNLSAPEIVEINGEDAAFAGTVPLERGDIVYVAASSIANAERTAIRIANILRPFYDLARTIVWGDAAIGVTFDGKRSNIVVDDK
jgi:polysaccharide biosynthesis/export protein